MEKVAVIHLMNFATSVGHAFGEDVNVEKVALSMLKDARDNIVAGDNMMSAAAEFERFRYSLDR
jgi:hypothetical protein